MPELPEAECVRQSLAAVLRKRRIIDVRIHRPDVVVRVHHNRQRERVSRRSRRLTNDLLLGAEVESIIRFGKQVAIVAVDGRVVCLALGMTGQVWYLRAGSALPVSGHIHIEWSVRDLDGNAQTPPDHVLFRDVRRFGSVMPFASLDQLESTQWSTFGPDALSIKASELRSRFSKTSRPVKAALLDQSLLSGVGNIYADESLFRAGIHPLRPCSSLTPDEITHLSRAIRRVLRAAIRAGGTTLRYFVDGFGHPGSFRQRLVAYGRHDEPCTVCGRPMSHIRITQRTTTFCTTCQPMNETAKYPRVVHTNVDC